MGEIMGEIMNTKLDFEKIEFSQKTAKHHSIK